MELNREQIVIEITSIIKALKVNNGWWENKGRGGWFNHDILEDALALIKELTEENKKLADICAEKIITAIELDKQVAGLSEQNQRWRNECENQSVLWKQHFESVFQTAKETVKSDSVRLMKVRLKEELSKITKTRDIHDEEECNLDSDEVWEVIDRVAKEIEDI